MGSLMDPSAWAELLTLVVLKIVLGIGNPAFIAILTDKLPPKQRDKAHLLGLPLTLTMRLGLLSLTSWIVTLTKPLFIAMNFSFSGRNLIVLFGGIFLLFRATTELYEQLENRDHNSGHGEGYASFQVVVTQIVIFNAIFSLDTIITAVGMVNHLPVVTAAIVITMAVMLLVSRPLTRFVDQHPTVVVLCLSFLLVIGLSLVTGSLGFHIPKGYLYTAIGFSIIIEVFNQTTRRNFIRHQSVLPLRAHTADAIPRLMGGKRQANVQRNADSPMPVPILEGAFTERERYTINGVSTLASRPLHGAMTPRGEISWAGVSLGVNGIREQLLFSPRSLFSICRGGLDEIIGIVHAKKLPVALEEGVDVMAIVSVSLTIIVPETLDSINLLDVLRRARGSFVIVTNEFGMVQGLVTSLDVLEAIVGESSDADETPEIITGGNDQLVEDGTDLHALQQTLGVECLADDDDAATVAGLMISANGHIPRVGDMIDVEPLHITIIEADGYRIDLVRTVKE